MLNDFSDLSVKEAAAAMQDAKIQLVPINYDPEYSDLMALFRPLCVAQEYSLRVLNLTSKILEFNPSHYSVWKYRHDLLQNLDDLELWKDELEFLNQMGAENPKSYQIWLEFLIIGIIAKLSSRKLVTNASRVNLYLICWKTTLKTTIAGNTSNYW